MLTRLETLPPDTPTTGLDRYLDEIGANMTALSDAERVVELAEIRVHLDALVRAHQELGADGDTALAHAIAQFGHARRIARELNDAHRRPERRRARTLAGAVGVTLALSIVAAALRESIRLAGIVRQPDGTMVRVDTLSMTIFELAVPVVIGLCLGSLFPRIRTRPLILTAAAIANGLLCLQALLPVLTMGNGLNDLTPYPMLITTLLFRVLNVLVWTALGTGAADWAQRTSLRQRAFRRAVQ